MESKKLEGQTFSYVLITRDGRETELNAIGDSQAMGRCQKLYPHQKWELFRLMDGQRIPVCLNSPKCPPPIQPQDPGQPPAFS